MEQQISEVSSNIQKTVVDCISHNLTEVGILNEDGMNAKVQFSSESNENVPAVKDDRVIRKAKRLSSKSESAAEGGESCMSGCPRIIGGTALSRRRCRKSRHKSAKSGEPKKGGAGGKGVWGKLGSELDETSVCKDINDPNYDSDSQGEYKMDKVEPILTEEQLEKAMKPILQEYLEHGNTYEVGLLLNKLNVGPNGHKVMRMAVQLGLDHHNPKRELISQLISDLHTYALSEQDIAKGFDELLGALDDLHLDTPEAPHLLGQFMARCVADDCLPPKFIHSYKGKVDNKLVISALEKADVLLSMNHGMAHLDNIWGVGGGNRPVTYLSNKMEELLKEYILSKDLKEAVCCLQELEVPHFHHELVFQAFDLAIEDSSERAMELVADLLKFMTESSVVTTDQFEKGIKRFCVDIDDISIDVPAAHSLMEQFVMKLCKRRLLSDALLRDLPSRGRKRFVSEGDGGNIKNGSQDHLPANV